MSVEIRMLGHGEAGVLARVAPDVFDNAIDDEWCAEFFRDSRHHLAVALDRGLVVGFASAVHYVHPDKPPELWINEVGVAPTHRQRGLGRGLLAALLEHAGTLGCVQAWVLTSPANAAARRLYSAAGGRAAAEASLMFEFPVTPGRPSRRDDHSSPHSSS
ncbi:MAG TPA: GNAT family N-acetyltransferase [Gemmatimonadales bacterium]|nr:GNAT family N-acetyltransferase [Gemmatimonadales bacterium]